MSAYLPIQIPHKEIFNQMIDGYNAIVNNPSNKSAEQILEEKRVYINNASILISALVKADTKQEFVPSIKQGIEDFSQVVDLALKSEFDHVFKGANADIINAEKSHQLHIDTDNAPAKAAGAFDLDKFINETLAKSLSLKFSKEKGVKNSYGIKSNAKLLAQDLKEVNLQHMRNISLSNLEKRKFEKEEFKNAVPLAKMIDSVNNVTSMVTNDVILAKDKGQQKRIYKFYVQVMDESIKNGDYQSAMAIYLGLNKINRLKYLQDEQPDVKRKFDECGEFLSPSGKYAKLREGMKSFKEQNKDSAIIPILSSTLQEMVFLEDGNPKFRNESDKKINPYLIELGGKIVSGFMEYQNKALSNPPQTLQSNAAQRLLKPMLSGDDAYDRSLMLYPKNQTETFFPPKIAPEQKRAIESGQQIKDKLANEAKESTKVDIKRHMKEPIIPKQVADLANKGRQAYQDGKMVRQPGLYGGRGDGWLEQTFGKNERELITQLKDIPAPTAYNLGDIKSALEPRPTNDKVESTKFTVVQGVGANDLNHAALGNNAIYQIASQFDFQESTSTHDATVEKYRVDMTQGPQAALESASASLHRKAAKHKGALPHALAEVLPQSMQKYYTNGYLNLQAVPVSEKRALLDHINKNIDKLKILPQWVNCEASGAKQLQVFCAAPQFTLLPKDQDPIDKEICKQLVVAQYVAIAQLAVIRSREIKDTVPMHLTMVGQGAFNNDPSIMREAMKEVEKIVKGENVAVYVHAFRDDDVAKLIPHLEGIPYTKMSATEFEKAPHPGKVAANDSKSQTATPVVQSVTRVMQPPARPTTQAPATPSMAQSTVAQSTIRTAARDAVGALKSISPNNQLRTEMKKAFNEQEPSHFLQLLSHYAEKKDLAHIDALLKASIEHGTGANQDNRYLPRKEEYATVNNILATVIKQNNISTENKQSSGVMSNSFDAKFYKQVQQYRAIAFVKEQHQRGEGKGLNSNVEFNYHRPNLITTNFEQIAKRHIEESKEALAKRENTQPETPEKPNEKQKHELKKGKY